MARTNTVRKQAAVTNNVSDLVAANARKFGGQIGKGEREIEEEADRQHATYAKLSDAGKKAMKAQFMVGYLSAKLQLSNADATRILKKHDTPDQNAAKKAGSMAFLHRIARTGAKALGGTGTGRGKGKAKGGSKYGVTVTKAQAHAARKLVDSLFALFPAKDVATQYKKVKTAIDMLLAEEAKAAQQAE